MVFAVSIAGNLRMHGITNYIIVVSNDVHRWFVWRRYSAINALHEALQKHMNALPSMPPKSILKISKDFEVKRQQELEVVLQAVVSGDPELRLPILKCFFDVPPYVQLEIDDAGHRTVDAEKVASFKAPLEFKIHSFSDHKEQHVEQPAADTCSLG
mmetsp:Transcript_121839/g.192989  ORF Transcript_121839/g.192989 Transcript_121839/m.192989 type:complete len:156 (-) Transcript_121839:170-637(-)